MTQGRERAASVRRLASLLVDASLTGIPDAPGAWDDLVELAIVHGLGPALWVAMRDAGLASSVPKDARTWMRTRAEGLDAPLLVLEDAYDANVAHQRRLLELARFVVRTQRVGPVTPLKGLHTMLIGLWPDAGARAMVDVDLLAPVGGSGAVFDELVRAGLEEVPGSLGEHADHQLPALRDGDGACVEVHAYPMRRRWERLLAVDEIAAASTVRETAIGPVALMSATHAVVVHLAHGQLQDDAFRRLDLPLRALHETDRWVRASSDVDWDDVARRFGTIHARAALRSHLDSAAALFGTPDPLGDSRRGRVLGSMHAHMTRGALRMPRAHGTYNYLQYLPRSFERDRMVTRYGPPEGRAWLARARVRHVVDRVAQKVDAGAASTAVRHVRRRLRRARFSSFVQANTDVRSTVLLVGTGRSGTTWIAQVLAARPRCRLIFEPFRAGAVRLARGFVEGEYLPPTTHDPARLDAAINILAGRVRSRWTDRLNRSHLVTRRVVKCIRITNLVPWFAEQLDDLVILYLVRHPCAVAVSRMQAGFPDRLDELRALTALCEGPLAPYSEVISEAAASGDRFEREIVAWCMQNSVPLAAAGPDLPVFLFEDLVLDPERELERLAAASGLPMGRRARAAFGRTQGYGARRATTAAVRAGRVDGWLDAVDAPSRQRADAIITAFGLGDLYSGLDPLPRCHGRDLVRADA